MSVTCKDIINVMNRVCAYLSCIVLAGCTSSLAIGQPMSNFNALGDAQGVVTSFQSADRLSWLANEDRSSYLKVDVIKPLPDVRSLAEMSVPTSSGGGVYLCSSVKCHSQGGFSMGTVDAADGYALSINGKVVVEGLFVSMSGEWPDYVFDDDYDLMPLSVLKVFVRKNRHLPGMPSADAVSTNGIDLAGMSAKLLEKTEELTLYLIGLETRLERLESSKRVR